MRREAFSVAVTGGQLHGWTGGTGAPIVLLHGGPGMAVDYMAALISELANAYRVAWYQQRGLEPSTAGAPFTVDTQVKDVVAVIEHLGWRRPLVAGHSWGGHLLLHTMARFPDHIGGACVIDALGAVGDAGMADFEAEIIRRTPPADRERAEALDELALAGRAGPDQNDEAMRLVWPAYFPNRESAPPYRTIAMSSEAYGATYASLLAELPLLEAGLSGCSVPTTLVHGRCSPMPTSATTATAALLTDQVVEIVDDAGHFIWLDRPGVVTASIERLTARIEPSES